LVKEARLFGAACFVVALFGIANFVAGLFWRGLFWRKFHENNVFLSLFFIFFFFFSKSVEDFLFIFNKFLYFQKKYKFKYTATVFFI